MPSRRVALGAAAAALAGMNPYRSAKAATLRSEDILSLFQGLPGDIALKIIAPATDTDPRIVIAQNASQRLFVGSAIKTFALAKALQQADSPDLIATLSNQMLTLDQSVWNGDSQILNPPNLAGMITERTALEAMILHSDNTATDMIFKYLGPDNIRAFISSNGLKSTSIPDSTRSFFGYILGAADYQTYSWAELQASSGVFVRPPLNDVSTLASSCDDLVSYYSHGLQGKFFKHPETLNEYRRILNLGDVIWIVEFPLGTTTFAKGGSIDTPGFHCLCIPGGMAFEGRWVFFSFIINWYNEATTDPATVSAFLAAVKSAVTVIYQHLSVTGGKQP